MQSMISFSSIFFMWGWGWSSDSSSVSYHHRHHWHFKTLLFFWETVKHELTWDVCEHGETASVKLFFKLYILIILWQFLSYFLKRNTRKGEKVAGYGVNNAVSNLGFFGVGFLAYFSWIDSRTFLFLQEILRSVVSWIFFTPFSTILKNVRI